ncbi:MAG: ABC transporter permease [Acidobacteria bacterium]|nr:ABC transporter permease [Acidobacteriota bacterium]
MPIFTIAHLTLLETRRRRILLAGLLCGMAFVVLFATALSFVERSLQAQTALDIVRRRTALHALTVAGLYVANFLTLITAALLPVDTLSGEIASGVTQTLASKPIRRAEIVVGKWLAHWMVAAAYLAVTAGGVILASRVVSGFLLPGVERGLPLMLLEATVMLTVSIAGGTRFSTVTNGLVAFGVFGMAFIGGWVEQIGEIITDNPATRQAVRDVGTVASLISPTDSLWRLAAYHMLPTIARDLSLTPFTQIFPPSNAVVVWAAGYVLVVLAIALRQFQRRAL